MRLATLILVLIALVLASTGAVGCGGDDDDDGGAATEATTTEEAAGGGGGAAEVSMTEYAFDPADATVSQGESLGATNNGELTHNYTVEGVPEQAGNSTEDVPPGTRGAFGVTLKPGEYDVICTIPGHAEKGMKGTLTVK